MSTRCQIGFYSSKDVMLAKPDTLLYRHSDGYPEGVLPDLLPIVARFDKERGLSDTEYAAAWTIHTLIQDHVEHIVKLRREHGFDYLPVDGKDFLSHGVCNGFHCDIEYYYRVHPGQVLVYSTPFDTPPSKWKLIQTINLDDVPMPEIKEPDPVRVVITIEGGLVNDVFSDSPVSVLKIDYDVEGTDMDDITTFELIPDGGTLEAFASFFDADVHVEMVDRYVNAITTEFNRAQAEVERSTKSDE